MKKLISEVNSNYSALVSLTEANLKITVETTRLGWFWWIINPLVMMGIYYVFVNIILNRGGDNYHLFVLTGLIAWHYFNNAFAGTVKVIIQNTQLIKQVALPIPMLILIPVLVQMIFAIIGVMVIMVWNFEMLGSHTFLVIPLILLTGLTSYGFGLFVSVCNVFIGDIEQLLHYVLRMGFFLSPVLFPAEYVLNSDKLPEFFKLIFQVNPMAILITAYRSVLLDGNVFNLSEIMVLTIGLIMITQLGLYWVRLNSSQIVKML
ncbi:MAG: ABC transporter permease [Bacteroidetes bacterium]|nr:ABC transporter permease [Bacteroidota bacterium]